jgi:CheY-like chemotaxis protein
VVDDAPTIVKMVTRMLTAAGATVDFAKDGREGVDVFKAADPAFDMVVTDIQVSTQTTHHITHIAQRRITHNTRCITHHTPRTIHPVTFSLQLLASSRQLL